MKRAALISAFWSVLCGFALGGGSALAQDAPEKPLGDVLDEIATRAGAVIVAPADLIADRASRAPEVSGTMEDMLDAALSPHGLSYELTASGAVVLTDTRQADPLSGSGADIVVVKGSYSASLRASLETKRRALNFVDAVDASDIADYPALNIAESLLRVPGVSITRDRGEGVFVSVRGLSPGFQRVLLNGRPLAVNENVRDSGQFGRQFRFDTISPDLIAGVDIIKTPRAHHEEGAMGAIINLRTYKPFDLPGSGGKALASVGSPMLSGRISHRYAGLANWRSAEDDIGALIGLVYSDRTVRQDRITGVSFEKVATTGQAGQVESIIVPHALRPTLEFDDRKLFSALASVQWRAAPETQIELEAYHARLNNKYTEYTYSAGVNDYNTAVLFDSDFLSVVEGTGQSQIGLERSRLLHTNSFLSFDMEKTAGPWEVAGRAAAGQAISKTADPIQRTRLLGEVGLINLSWPQDGDDTPSIRFAEADLTRADLLPFRRIEWRTVRSRDNDLSAGVEAARTSPNGFLKQLSVGGQWRRRKRDYARIDHIFDSLEGERFPQSYFDPFPVNSFLDAEGDLPRRWAVPKAELFFAASDTLALDGPPAEVDKVNSYTITEEISSLYGSFLFAPAVLGRPSKLELGFRLSHTQEQSSGFALDDGAAIPVSFEKSYTDFLPSANWVLNLTNGLQLRTAYARVITRPSLADLAPRLTFNSSGVILEARGGNPNLERYRASQYDAAFEYYFDHGGLATAGVFYKDIDVFVFDQTSPLIVNGLQYMLTGPANGGDAKVMGVELALQQRLSFLPAPFDRFGYHVNYTHTESEAVYPNGRRASLPYVSKNSYNLTGYYETEGVEARLSYSWRDDLLSVVNPDTDFSIHDAAFGSFDGSLSFLIGERAKLSLEGVNLLGAPQRNVISNGAFAGYTNYGRSVSMTVRLEL